MSSRARSEGEVGPGDGGKIGSSIGGSIGSSQELCHLFYVASNVISKPVLFSYLCVYLLLRLDRLLPVPALAMAPLLADALKNLESVVIKRKEPDAVKAFQSLQKELAAAVSLSAFAFETPVVGQL